MRTNSGGVDNRKIITKESSLVDCAIFNGYYDNCLQTQRYEPNDAKSIQKRTSGMAVY